MNSLPIETLCKIIELLMHVVEGGLILGLSIFIYFHKGLLRRLDEIDADMKPTRTDMAVLKQRMNDFHDRVVDVEKRINDLEN